MLTSQAVTAVHVNIKLIQDTNGREDTLTGLTIDERLAVRLCIGAYNLE